MMQHIEKFDFDVLGYFLRNYEQIVYANINHEEHGKECSEFIQAIEADRSSVGVGQAVSAFLAQARAFFSASARKNPNTSIGVLSVQYHPSATDSDGNGRLYAHKSLSLQGMYRMIRHTIAHEFYVDLDLVNAHPSLLAHVICPRYKLDCPRLLEYVNQREEIIEQILQVNPGVSRDCVKQTIISIINNGNKLYRELKKTTWLREFKSEMSAIIESLTELEPKMFDQIVHSKKSNPEGSLISKLMCIEENTLLMDMYHYIKETLGENSAKSCVLCFDGIMIPREDFPKISVREMERRFLKLGVPMKLKEKTMTPLVLQNFIRRKVFDVRSTRLGNKVAYVEADGLVEVGVAESNYYFSDFSDFLSRKTFRTFHEVIEFFTANVNRVIVRVLPEMYFIKKDRDVIFEPCRTSEIPQIPIRWYETKGEKVVLEKRGLRDLITKPTDIYPLLITYDAVYLKPTTTITPDTMFDGRKINIWGGFQARLLSKEETEARLGECQPWLDHMRVVLAADNQEYYDYLCTWFHQAFKFPEKKTKVALVFRSMKQQVGKGLFVREFLQKFIYGERSSWNGKLDDMVGRFNFHLQGKLLVNLEELSSLEGTNYHGTFDFLKSVIADSKIRCEIKNGRNFEMENFMNIIALTNNDFTIKVEYGDARYFIVDCDERYSLNFKYFKNFTDNYLNQGSADVFFSYMYHYQPTRDVRDIPATELKRRMMINSLSTPRRFVEYCKDLLNDSDFFDEDITWHKEFKDTIDKSSRIKPSALYHLYLNFCSEEQEKPISMQKFGRELTDVLKKVMVQGRSHYKFTKEEKPVVDDYDGESSDF